jgi:hypothetical protein
MTVLIRAESYFIKGTDTLHFETITLQQRRRFNLPHHHKGAE